MTQNKGPKSNQDSGAKFSLKDADMPSLHGQEDEGPAPLIGGINPGRGGAVPAALPLDNPDNQAFAVIKPAIKFEPQDEVEGSENPTQTAGGEKRERERQAQAARAAQQRKPQQRQAQPQPLPAASAPPQAQPPKSGAGGRRRENRKDEVSEIKGLSSGFTQMERSAAATELGPAMIRPPGNFRPVFKWTFLVLLLAGIGYVLAVEDVRNNVIDFVKDAKKNVIGAVRYQPKNRKKDTQKNLYDKTEVRKTNAPRPAPTVGKSGARRSCQALISGTFGAGKIAVTDRVALAECYLMIDDLVSAEDSLTKIRSQLISTPESLLNTMKASRNLADAYLTLVTIYAMQGKFREASELTRGKCLRWTVSNTCVARAVVSSMRSAAAGVARGASVLFQTTGGLDRKMQARLWWAGAMMAEKEKRPPTIDQRYSLAMKAAPSEAIALKKLIFESYAVSLYNRVEMIKLNAVVSRAMGELSRIDRKSKIKLEILRDLAASRNDVTTVRALLTSENVAYRARNDFELLDILGAAAIRARQADPYLRLAKRSRDFYAQKKFPSHPNDRPLSQWEIRVVLGKGEFETALTMLSTYEAKHGRDLFLHHMKGVAYHQMSSDPRFQLQAATEFQNAIRTRKNWESLQALGVTMVRAGKLNEAAPILKDLERMIKTRGQKYWLEMLKAEWYIGKQKYLNAEKILNDWSRDEIEYFTPRNLKLKLYKVQGRSNESTRVESELADISRTKRFDTSFEGLSSPLGLMAVGERPID